MIRQLGAAVLLIVILLASASASTSTPASAQDEPPASDDIAAQCRTIIGCPDAGPKPENPGDRGGYAQLITLVVLAGGVGFIMTKVVGAARASQPKPPG